jgi:hypothetical protein
MSKNLEAFQVSLSFASYSELIRINNKLLETHSAGLVRFGVLSYIA